MSAPLLTLECLELPVAVVPADVLDLDGGPLAVVRGMSQVRGHRFRDPLRRQVLTDGLKFFPSRDVLGEFVNFNER